MNGFANIKFRTALFWAAIILLVILSFFILRPFIIPLISAFVLAYLVRPVYIRLEKSSNSYIAAAITLVLAIGIIVIPILLIGSALISQAQQSLNVSSIGTTLGDKLSSIEILSKMNLDFGVIKEKTLALLISTFSTTIKQVPILILSLAITILATYYMLIRWNFLVEKVKEFVPFKHKEALFSSISRTTNYIIYGYFLLALVEFCIASIGFYIAGLENYLLLPLLLGMTAFIPGVGPAMVWVPTFIFQLISGDYYAAIVILITGLTISIVIETIIFSKLVGDKASIHPLMILLGILGGIPLFGIFGFIIGPLVLSYTVRILEQSLKEN